MARIKCLSFNIWWGGHSKPLVHTANIIRNSGADIIGLQESFSYDSRTSQLPQLMQLLNNSNNNKTKTSSVWHGFSQSNACSTKPPHERHNVTQYCAVVSKFPIVRTSNHGIVTQVDVPNVASPFYFANVHFNHFPYQPFQLLGIPYVDDETGITQPNLHTEEDAINSAANTRDDDFRQLEGDIHEFVHNNNKKLLVLTGDFNEPSHLDWTEIAASQGVHPMRVRWPTSTKIITQLGLQDSYRSLYPNVVESKGHTWCTLTTPEDPKDHHDRIDIMYHCPSSLRVVSAHVLGETFEVPYPSDHRAVFVEYEVI
eukprot:PhF_6_TR21191/c1_g1_i1/m.30560